MKKTIPRKKRKKILIPKFVLGILTSLLVLITTWLSNTLTPIRTPTNTEQVALYANQVNDDLRQVFITAIDEAKESILLIIYALTDDNVIRSLRAKSDAGIDVRIICDPKASPHLAQRLGPKVQVFQRFTSGLMHQKILVIDGIRTWIGSANMTTDSLRMHGNLIAAFHSPELAAAVSLKANQMKLGINNLPIPCQKVNVGDQQVELWFCPDNPEGVSRIKQLIDTAQKTIRVAMFTWTRQDLTQAIIKAKKRGVDVQTVIDYLSAKGASAEIVKLLHKGGVPVRLNQGNALLHHKFLYIDGKTLVNGSANWTKAAFTKNDDCFVVLHPLSEKQEQYLDRLWSVIHLDSAPAK